MPVIPVVGQCLLSRCEVGACSPGMSMDPVVQSARSLPVVPSAISVPTVLLLHLCLSSQCWFGVRHLGMRSVPFIRC